MSSDKSFELTFLGSGNAYGAEGRAFSSLLLNDRFMFDCGPTVLQQLTRLGLSSDQVDAVFISHFHADHFFGLPFLYLDCWRRQRSRDLLVVGPPGIEERAEHLFDLAFGSLPPNRTYHRRYVEVRDGIEAEAAGLAFCAGAVEHVPNLESFGFRVTAGGRSLVYSGDVRQCQGLVNLITGADVLILECSCAGEIVHLSPDAIDELVRHAKPDAKTIVTHLDGRPHPRDFQGLIVASDLAKFSL